MFKRECVCWLICNRGFHTSNTLQQCKPPRHNSRRTSIAQPQKLHAQLRQRGKNNNNDVLEKPSLFAFFPQYHQIQQQQQQGSVLLMLNNISWSDFSLDLPLSRRTRDVRRSFPARVPLRAPEPLQPRITRSVPRAEICILLHTTSVGSRMTQGIHCITGA